MKTYLVLILCCVLILPCSIFANQELGQADSARFAISYPAWPFFAFCMDTHDEKKRTLAEQAVMLKELGYAGCGHLWLDDVETRARTLSNAGLRLYQVYVRVNLANPQPLNEKRVMEILPVLKPHKTQLALLISGGKSSDNTLDDRAVAVIHYIADMVRPHNVSVVLYPHTGDWLETSGDAVRIAKKVNLPSEVGIMFNLCHWMKTDSNRNLWAVLEEAQPWLMAVSLSGSDRPEQVFSGKGNWIQPLDSGTYEIKDFLDVLRDINYSGLVGLQCWGIPGDARTHLKRSIETWKRLTTNK